MPGRPADATGIDLGTLTPWMAWPGTAAAALLFFCPLPATQRCGLVHNQAWRGGLRRRLWALQWWPFLRCGGCFPSSRAGNRRRLGSGHLLLWGSLMHGSRPPGGWCLRPSTSFTPTALCPVTVASPVSCAGDRAQAS